MTPELWQQVTKVLAAALEREPPERRAYLDQVCTDLSVRREVELLMDAYEQGGSTFLENPAVELKDIIPPALSRSEVFKGTERFEIQRRLGSGGFGVVYRAFDRKLNTLVALKTLLTIDVSALYRFKKEFRTLADIAHPHLVTLYELLSDGDQWFFTMELIDGRSLVEYLRASPESSSPGSGAGSSNNTATDSSKRNPDQVRSTFAQLADGVCMMHEHGIVHRDIKPSNVLVTKEGRVVLLDFGLVAGLSGEEVTQSSRIVGTPVYMSPEQAAGLAVSEASDWYSVGVMLYEALTGQPPLRGRFLDVVIAKQTYKPPMLDNVVAGVPEDLSSLCQQLLQPDPKARPSGREILYRLGGSPLTLPPVFASPRRPETAQPLVGRQRHLDFLSEAFHVTKEGHAVTVCVRGQTGVGKSTLVDWFARDIRQRDPDVVLLSGRCYERESVPYKALDSLIDALSQYLKRLPPTEAERIMPRNAPALARLFPVLRQVEAVVATRRHMPEIQDSQELRRRAFTALRELLARLADERPVILLIDDLQWGDSDSGALLGEVLRSPDPPALLLIVCFRSEEAQTNPLLKALRYTLAVGDVRDLEVEELAFEDASELALALLNKEYAPSTARAQAIAEESGGNPFFIHELVRYAALGMAETEQQAPTVDQAIWARISQLSQQARRVLEVIAVAGRPLAIEEAKRAAGVAADEQVVIPLLRNEHLVWTRGRFESSEAEMYHDRIRQTVIHHLENPDLKSLHRRLAQVMEASGRADAEILASHFQGAGEFEKAASYALEAATQAAEALAFDRSARLYRLALELNTNDPQAGSLQAKLGEALANAGRGAEAAEAYIRAAERAEAPEALDFRRRAAEQLLKSGRINEGVAILGGVLAGIGMKLPETPGRARASITARRVQLRLRGFRFRERNATQLSLEKLHRIDTCWAAAVGLGVVDPIRGADFQARHLQLALRAGEPYRVARALALEVGFSGTGGSRTHAKTQKLLHSTMALAERIGNPHALGLATMNAGIAARLEGRFREGVELCDRAEEILRERCTGVAWEVDTAEIFSLTCLVMLGNWQELARRLPILIKEVEARGDLYPTSYMRTRIAYLLCLAADESDRASEEERLGVALWSQRGFFTLHYSDLMARAEIDLYRGNGDAAWGYLQQRWPAFAGSLLPRVQSVFIESLHLRARCALAKATAGEKAYFLEIAERDAYRIEREKTPWGDPLALLIHAAVAVRRGRHEAALPLLFAAEKGFETTDMGLFRAAARRRRGELLGGDEGRVLVESADGSMAAQKIKNPIRMSEMLSPGYSN